MLKQVHATFSRTAPTARPWYIAAGTFNRNPTGPPTGELGKCTRWNTAKINPTTFIPSRTTNGRAVLLSKNPRDTTPPFAVTLKLPSFGLIRASIVGKKMYGASTV